MKRITLDFSDCKSRNDIYDDITKAAPNVKFEIIS